MYSVPQGNSFKSPFYQWHFLGIFSHKYLANGVCPWKANAVRLVESQDCGKDRAGTAEGSAAVSFMGVGSSVYVDGVTELANLSDPRSSLAVAPCGLRCAYTLWRNLGWILRAESIAPAGFDARTEGT